MVKPLCRTLHVCLLIALIGSAGAKAAESRPAPGAAKRPNVVFLLADQWRAQAMGYAGDPNARTPNLDRLGAQGVILTTAVSICPVCSPYRASLMTGRGPTTHGVFVNDVCLNRDAVSLAQAFSSAGYRTAFIGKWHLDGHGRSNFIPPERRQGFEFWRVCECTHDYNHSLYYADTDQRQYWKGYDAEAQTDEAAQYIRSHKAEPFLLILSWGPPHNPYESAPARFREQFKPEALQLRPNVPPEVDRSTRHDLAGYYAHCAALDGCAGRIDQVLRECGIADDTILVFTSDHGDMLGSHGQVRKQRPWDEAVRVPFLVRWASGLGQAGRKLTAPINTPDIMPTLLGLCGLPIPASVEGTDRSAWLCGRQADDDRAVLISCVSPFGEWTRPKGGREYRGVRTARYTYVRSLEGPWLLYDNQEDPYQQRNRIGEAGMASIQAELDTQLQQQLRQYKDEFRPAEEHAAHWGYTTDKNGTVPYRP